ncbi:MAG: hypothetical protein NWE89_00640 [Candidatus Bathyarchaeota archaeon]|nr:hypothetical protein [Candidatus Bathyarchaeota archaeon]
MTRSEKIRALERLNKSITWKLEEAGYMIREKRGHENVYSITESEKYVACVSGFLG